jgi:hypothetical protein
MRWAIAGLALVLAVGVAGCAKKPPPYETAVSMKELMAQVVDPQSQIFWHSSGSVDDEKGSHVLTPTTPEGWAAADNAMAIVAEAGNMMMLPGRAKDDGDWIKFSKAMSDQALLARAATRAKNGDKMFETGAALYETCQGCHQKYLLPTLGPDGKPKAQGK